LGMVEWRKLGVKLDAVLNGERGIDRAVEK
jgi:hypothetical protein